MEFDPSVARDAVSAKGDAATAAEPKNKDDFVKALVARDSWKDKEAELKKMKLPKLKELWKKPEEQSPADGTASSGDALTKDIGVES